MITKERLQELIDYQQRRRFHILDENEEMGILDALFELKSLCKQSKEYQDYLNSPLDPRD